MAPHVSKKPHKRTRPKRRFRGDSWKELDRSWQEQGKQSLDRPSGDQSTEVH